MVFVKETDMLRCATTKLKHLFSKMFGQVFVKATVQLVFSVRHTVASSINRTVFIMK